MPKNYFINREERSMLPNKVKAGDFVFIVEKQKQGCKTIDELVLGKIKNKLSNGDRYKNGAKQMVIPISAETRKKIKPIIDLYFKNAILHFNDKNYDLQPYIDKFNEGLKELQIDLDDECSKYEGELIVGRIQYYLYPENYKPKPKINILKLGLSNNQICDINTLQQQIQYIKSNYYINCSNYDENLNKLIKFRTLINTFDINTLNQMNIYPNYCEFIIENNKYLKDIKYYELN